MKAKLQICITLVTSNTAAQECLANHSREHWSYVRVHFSFKIKFKKTFSSNFHCFAGPKVPPGRRGGILNGCFVAFPGECNSKQFWKSASIWQLCEKYWGLLLFAHPIFAKWILGGHMTLDMSPFWKVCKGHVQTVPRNIIVKFKSISLTVLEQLAFNAQKFRGTHDHGHAPFQKFCNGSCSDCRWKHAGEIWSQYLWIISASVHSVHLAVGRHNKLAVFKELLKPEWKQKWLTAEGCVWSVDTAVPRSHHVMQH